MKVGLYVTSLSPKGAAQARFQAGVFEGLLRHNVGRHHFFVFTDSIPTDFKDNESFTYVRIRRNGKLEQSWCLFKWQIGRIVMFSCGMLGLSGGRIATLIHSWRASEPKYYKQLRELGIRLMWYVNGHELLSWLPYISTVWAVNHRIHPMYPEFSYTRFQFESSDRGMEQSLAKASYVIAGTEEGKNQIISLYGAYDKKVRVIPFPTPVLPFVEGKPASNLEFKFNGPYVFYPARFWPHKNHVVIIAALKVLRQKWNLTVNAVFSGADEGNLGYVLQYAQALGVRDQVIYVGEVAEAELVRLYKGALALVYASAVGPDNLPPLEAMSVGCPAIVAEVPGAREQYGDACLFFHPMDEVALSSLIKLVLDDPLAREALVSKGLYRAKQWSVEDYATEIISILDEFELVARSWGPNDATFT
jgi:glycosyltransferase involved in cell wall biosynthesis